MNWPELKPDHWRALFGFCLLIILASLALIIALGEVTETTSHGLMPLITAIATLSGNFANWAFRSDPVKPEEKKEP